MKKAITAFLLCLLLAQSVPAAELQQKQLICKEDPGVSWKNVDWKKSLHGAYLMSTWFYWKNGRYDLSQHVLFNEGADQIFDKPFIMFSLMLGKEFIDKTGFSWSDVFLGNLPPLLFNINYGKLYRSSKIMLGYKVEEPVKLIKMRDNDGKKYVCTFVDAEKLKAQLEIQDRISDERD